MPRALVCTFARWESSIKIIGPNLLLIRHTFRCLIKTLLKMFEVQLSIILATVINGILYVLVAFRDYLFTARCTAFSFPSKPAVLLK